MKKILFRLIITLVIININIMHQEKDNLTKTKTDIIPCNEWPLIEDENTLRQITAKLNGWDLLDNEKTSEGKVIYKLSKKVKSKDFLSALDYFNKIGAIAEERNHHPDLHLTGFRNIEIIIFTFGLKGLTENDFNLAKSFDEIPLLK